MITAKGISAWLVCWSVLSLCSPSYAQPARIPVDQITVTGNTLLPPEVIDAALASYKGELSLGDLKQAAQAVQALYRDAGYGAVIAYVPEQTAASGRATIAVLEGRIGQVEVIGNSHFSAANIQRSVPHLKAGVTPQVRRLDTEVQMANENPAKQLALTLEAGKQAGEVDARVMVVEQPPTTWTVAVDTGGNDSTGLVRGYLRYQNAALWDLDHVLSLQAGSSLEKPSAAPSIAANYRIPMYEQAATLDLYAAYSDAEGGDTPTAAGVLQFNGRGAAMGLLSTTHLERIGEFDQQFHIGADVRLFLNECNIQWLPSGACGGAGESVSTNPMSITYSARRGGNMPAGFSLGGSWNLGLVGPYRNDANFQAVRDGAPSGYALARLSGYMAFLLPQQWQLQGRISSQFTADPLIPGEQFGIAGANTVRGYLEREVIGDQGIAGSLELYAPTLLNPMGVRQSTLQLLAFFDAGEVRNRRDTPCLGIQSVCRLSSIGLGLRARLQTLQLRLDVANALKDGNATASGRTRANFLATYSF